MAQGSVMRALRHVVTDHGTVRRSFPPSELARVEAATAAGEKRHRGQVCVAIEGALPVGRVLKRVTPRERALEVFGVLRVWDTEENCGVLVYLLLADRDVEIVADRGIHAKVGDDTWNAICHRMEKAFRAGQYAEAVEEGVLAVSDLLAQHSPDTGGERNEIPDKPIVL